LEFKESNSEVITTAYGRLEPLKLSPSQRTINNILAYAEKSVNELSPLA
jgi:hypothetical protein